MKRLVIVTLCFVFLACSDNTTGPPEEPQIDLSISVLEPKDNTLFWSDETIPCKVQVSPAQYVNNVVWTFGGQVAGCVDNRLTVSNLPVGQHPIAARVETHKQVKADTVKVVVRERLPPEASVLNPESGTIFFAGDTILFRSEATDPYSESLPEDSFIWTSDKDGELGKGSSLSLVSLSVGVHEITLSVIGVSKLECVTVFSITIRERLAPEVSLLEPEDESYFFVGDTILFRSEATDPYSESVPDDSFIWTSDKDGELGKGSSLSLVSLSVGVHEITLSVIGVSKLECVTVFSIEIFPVLQGRVLPFRSRAISSSEAGYEILPAENIFVFAHSGEQVDSVLVAEDGRFVLKTVLAGNDSLRVCTVSTHEIHNGEYYSICTDEIVKAKITESVENDRLSFLLIPRQWTIPTGHYAGTEAEVRIGDALNTLGSPSTGSAFYGRRYNTILRRDEVFSVPRRNKPLRVAFDREHSRKEITAEDSIGFFRNAVDTLEHYLGIGKLFTPAMIEDIADSTKAILVGVDKVIGNWVWNSSAITHYDYTTLDITGGAISVNHNRDLSSYVAMHELTHVLGIGHTCFWPSLMPGLSICPPEHPFPGLVRFPSVNDVAHIQIKDVSREVQIDHGVFLGINQTIIGRQRQKEWESTWR